MPPSPPRGAAGETSGTQRKTRRRLSEKLKGQPEEKVRFNDYDIYNPSLTIADNILFGRIETNLVGGRARIMAALAAVLAELDISSLPFEAGLAWQVAADLDAAAMHIGAQFLLGRHDFTTFRDTKCQAKSPVKTLDIASVEAIGEQVIFHFEARSFLHSQVRSMVGTLVEVGLGKMTVEDVAAALAAADRTRCGPVAPPDGLYLVRVDY